MTVPPGVSLALTNGPLDDPVTWTRVDNLAGVLIETITIDRGRPDERSKTTPSQVVIKGKDTNGIFDPTNPNSPLFPWLVPEKQCAITLYNPQTTLWDWLFRGSVTAIDHTFDLKQKWTEFEITLTDWLKLLDDAEIVPDQAGMAVPFESQGDCYYTGQHCDDRQLAVLADAATAFEASVWPTNLLEVASGNLYVQGRAYPARTTLLSVIDEAVDAEYPVGTNRFMTKYGAYAFRGRYYRFVPEKYIPSNGIRRQGARMLHWQVGDTASNTSNASIVICQGLSFKTDDQDLINAALVTPVGISTKQLATNSENTFSGDGTSIVDYGVRTGGMSFENLIIGDADDGNTFLEEAASFADVIVQNYKNPVTYANQVIFKNPSGGATTAQKNERWALLQGIELSDLVTVTTAHPGGGGFNNTIIGIEQDHFVESLHYDISALQGDVWNVVLTVGMSTRQHYRYMSAFWKPPTVSSGGVIAEFIDTPTGLSVAFLDLSTSGTSGPLTGWAWDFGDGATSTLQNPTHVYAMAGTYLVNLTATGTTPDGSATVQYAVTVS